MAVSTSGKAVRPGGGLRGYLAATRKPLVSVAVTLPLLLLYNVGLVMPGNREMNAADLLSRTVVFFSGWRGFLVLNATLVLASIVMIGVLIRRGQFRPLHWVALCCEGLFYGLLMGHGVVWAMGHAHLLSVLVPDKPSFLQALSMSAGAGYWEELVFRLGLVGLPIAIAQRRAVGKAGILKVVGVACGAVAVSSFLFSLAHYVGGIETPEAYTFWYRTFSGVVFSAVFLSRGFAVAAYTHFLYDVVVMVF